eukprot:scaffold8466_cov41-Cyclotella_meneghiniana.AAC.2
MAVVDCRMVLEHVGRARAVGIIEENEMEAAGKGGSKGGGGRGMCLHSEMVKGRIRVTVRDVFGVEFLEVQIGLGCKICTYKCAPNTTYPKRHQRLQLYQWTLPWQLEMLLGFMLATAAVRHG